MIHNPSTVLNPKVDRPQIRLQLVSQLELDFDETNSNSVPL